MNEITNGLNLRFGAGAIMRAMDTTEKMDSILHKIDIGMFQANAPKNETLTKTKKIAVGMG